MNQKTKSFTRGGQITLHNLRMLTQINGTVINIACVCYIVIAGVLTYCITPHEITMNAYYWGFSVLSKLSLLMPKSVIVLGFYDGLAAN